MNIVLVELEAMLVLGFAIMKGIFKPKTVYYVCPGCNLVLRKYSVLCQRCNAPVRWD